MDVLRSLQDPKSCYQCMQVLLASLANILHAVKWTFYVQDYNLQDGFVWR